MSICIHYKEKIGTEIIKENSEQNSLNVTSLIEVQRIRIPKK